MGAIEEYGVILNFQSHPDVVGLIEHHQRMYLTFLMCCLLFSLIRSVPNFFSFFFAVGDSSVEVGSSVKGLVIDLSDGVVNISLKSELVRSVSKVGKKKVMLTCTLLKCSIIYSLVRT